MPPPSNASNGTLAASFPVLPSTKCLASPGIARDHPVAVRLLFSPSLTASHDDEMVMRHSKSSYSARKWNADEILHICLEPTFIFLIYSLYAVSEPIRGMVQCANQIELVDHADDKCKY